MGEIADSTVAQPRGPRNCIVEQVEHLTPDAVSIVLRDESCLPFEFEPGQFFNVGVEINGVIERRTFSATNAPGEFRGGLRLGVKRRPGGLVSNFMNDHLKPGDRLVIRGPGGRFVPARCKSPRHLVLIAGGSGVTPMVSIIRSILDSDCDVVATLIYANRTMADAMYADELNQISASWAGRLRVIYVTSEGEAGNPGICGKLDADMLAGILRPLPPGDQFMVCGAHAASAAAPTSSAKSTKTAPAPAWNVSKSRTGSRPAARLPSPSNSCRAISPLRLVRANDNSPFLPRTRIPDPICRAAPIQNVLQKLRHQSYAVTSRDLAATPVVRG